MFSRCPEESDPYLQYQFGAAAGCAAARCVFTKSTTWKSRAHASVIVEVMIKKPASVLAVQLVRPILRFTSDSTIQLDGFETVLSAILVHKTAHERMLVVSGTIWILNHRRFLRAVL